MRQLPYRFSRKTQTLRAAALALLLALAGARLPAAAAGADDAAARGAYLAAAAGCDLCHTAHGGAPYAGGRVLKTRFGAVVTPNITPDRRAGIGRWSASDFAQAMRWGIAPDDSRYLPAFPFPFYNRLEPRDLADLKAFLDRLPAVSRVNRAVAPQPFAAARGAVAVLAMDLPGPWRPDPGKGAVWNRGAYLVATVGRCGDCHTPRNWLGALDPDRVLAGGIDGEGHAAPDITPDPAAGIGRWSLGDIVTLLEDGQKPDFDFVGGAMGEVVKSTAGLDDADRRAIAVYLKSLPPIGSSATGSPQKARSSKKD